MSEQERIAFFEQYAPIAMDQQQKYGIPASVTLAQMALESAYGTSRLARNGNNFFGIKASSDWLSNGGSYGYYSDDAPNEKFCHYNSVEDSVYDHSRVLMLSHYKSCLKYDSTDYHNWLVGIKAGGYATASNYVAVNEALIRKYDLSKYDTMAVQQATQPIGYMRGTDAREQIYAHSTFSTQTSAILSGEGITSLAFIEGHWSMPVVPNADNTITVSSNFGPRTAPCPGASTNHEGLDIAVANVPVYATEDNGVVQQVGNSSFSGRNVTIAYNRPDGTSYEVKYLHLSEVNVKEGDIVNAGTQVAISGNTGKSTGPHLDMRVQKNGQTINPSEYLAEISVRGGFSTQFMYDSNDLLADYKNSMSVDFPSPVQDSQQIDQSNLMFAELTSSSDPSKWLEYLMKKEGAEGLGIGSGGDLIADIAGTILSGVISLGSLMGMIDDEAVSIDDRSGVKDETEISPETVVQRQRDSVNSSQAQHIASMNYDSQIVEQGVSQGRSLA